jgi:phosphoadenosine phosphosulfate reductase
MSKGRIHWCQKCNVPLISNKCDSCKSRGRDFISDLKPFFSGEFDFFATELNGKFLPHNLSFDLFRSRNKIVANGKVLFAFRVTENGLEIKSANNPEIHGHEKKSDNWKKIVSANKTRLLKIENEAIAFIRRTVADHKNKEAVVSFSGGKDSAVTAYLVKKALGKAKLIFSNTTIDFPETVKFTKDFAAKLDLELVELVPPRRFFELCEEMGPPSRMMRWCCFTQKSTPINSYYSKLNKQFLSFDGIRKSESGARGRLKRTHKNTKIIRQYSAYPIFNWSDFEVWLYLHYRKIPINPLYLNGYSRIGCYLCPNNGKFDDYLTSKMHPELSKEWLAFLLEYARKTGKTPSWVFEGKWKQRTTKYEKYALCSFQNVCSAGTEFIFKLKETAFSEEILEFFKIFGKYSCRAVGNKKFLRIVGDRVTVASITGSKVMRVQFNDLQRFKRSMFEVRKQLERAINCVKCGACVGSCANGAIQSNGGSIKIDESLCTGCLSCVTSRHLKQSCIALHYKRRRSIVAPNTLTSVPESEKIDISI